MRKYVIINGWIKQTELPVGHDYVEYYAAVKLSAVNYFRTRSSFVNGKISNYMIIIASSDQSLLFHYYLAEKEKYKEDLTFFENLLGLNS